MRNRLLPWSLGILAVSAVMTVSSAQACGIGLPFLSGSPTCANGQEINQACPAPTQSEDGNSDNNCIVSQKDVSKAVSTVGTMAAGGIGIASNVMQVLSHEAQRFVSTNQGL